MKSIQKEISDRALEMIMRDVLDGLEEMSLASAFTSTHTGCEILWIRPPDREHSAQTRARRCGGEVVDLQDYRKSAVGC